MDVHVLIGLIYLGSRLRGIWPSDTSQLLVKNLIDKPLYTCFEMNVLPMTVYMNLRFVDGSVINCIEIFFNPRTKLARVNLWMAFDNQTRLTNLCLN